MASDRRIRLLHGLVGSGQSAPTTRGLCDLAVEVTSTNGAGIMLFDHGASQGVLCTTDDVSARIEDLQFTLGEGPCIDACREDRPSAEADLAMPPGRWPAFGPSALQAGARAVFAFPIRVGAARLGALDLYRRQPGALSDGGYADALAMADLAAEMILLAQAGAPPGRMAAELEAGADLRYVVHQASGMVAAQLDVDVIQALVRLRAHAFATDRPLDDIARDIVGRKLRLNSPPDKELP